MVLVPDVSRPDIPFCRGRAVSDGICQQTSTPTAALSSLRPDPQPDMVPVRRPAITGGHPARDGPAPRRHPLYASSRPHD